MLCASTNAVPRIHVGGSSSSYRADMTKWSLASILICVSVLLTTVSGQQGQAGKDRGSDTFVEGELLVQFSSTLNTQQRSDALGRHNLARVRHFDPLDIDLVRVPKGLAVAAAAVSIWRSRTTSAAPSRVRHRTIRPGWTAACGASSR